MAFRRTRAQSDLATGTAEPNDRNSRRHGTARGFLDTRARRSAKGTFDALVIITCAPHVR